MKGLRCILLPIAFPRESLISHGKTDTQGVRVSLYDRNLRRSPDDRETHSRSLEFSPAVEKVAASGLDDSVPISAIWESEDDDSGKMTRTVHRGWR